MGTSRKILAAAAALCLLSATPRTASANVVGPDPTNRGLEVHLQPFVELPDSSNGHAPRINSFATVGGDLYVGEETDGVIYRVSGPTSDPVVTPWFDVAAAIEASTNQVLDTTNTFHGGLRSIAFHPDFATNGRFYTSVMESRPANPGDHRYLSDVANPVAADSVLIEWRVNVASGSPIASSYREVFRVGMPVYDHPIKGIAFNPFSVPGDEDYGLLYIGHGDGSVQSAVAGGGQNADALGKILRINPIPTGGDTFSVPASNPFVGDRSMLNAVYSIGHRNPHNLAFARHDGDVVLLASEAGRDNVEEVNIITPGSDYGWPQREGTFVHLAAGGGVDLGVAALPSDEAQNGFTFPAAQVGHSGPPGSTFVKEAIAGGYVVDNGSPLSGQYLYADFPASGRLFHSSIARLTGATTTLDPNDPDRDRPSDLTQAPTGLVRIKFDHDSDPSTPALDRASLTDVFNDSANYETTRADVRFGQGPAGELYISSKRNNTIYLVTTSLPGGPGGFNGSRSTFACGVELRGQGFDITWANQPANATAVVIERMAFSTSYWRGRVDADAQSFRDNGLLPRKSARMDFTVVAKDASNDVISSVLCRVRDTDSLHCTVSRRGGRFTVRYTENGSVDYVVRRQVVTDGPFWWRTVDSASPATDSARNGEIIYQVLGRNGSGVMTSASSCRIIS